jgi:pimeloyl-ACP methyl ester carboxylesterase
MKTWKIRLAILLSILAAAYLAVCVWVLVNQEDMLFDPTPISETTPGPGEEVFIPVGSGGDQGELHACWFPAADADAPTFLYLHGKTHNNSTHPEHAQWLQRLNYNVLMVDYRGFGKSRRGGKPNEAKVYEDAAAAWNHLTQKRGIKPQQIFIYGHSLGAAIAVELATHHPDAAGLVAESAFTSVPDMAKRDYWFLPTGLLLRLRFDSLQRVRTLQVPLLLIHGTQDEKVPFTMSKELYAAAPKPKKLLLIERAGHANCPEVGGVEYDAAVTTFVQTQLNRSIGQ